MRTVDVGGCSGPVRRDTVDGNAVDAPSVVGDLLGRIDLAQVAEVVFAHQPRSCIAHASDVQPRRCRLRSRRRGGGGLGEEERGWTGREKVLVVTVYAVEARRKVGTHGRPCMDADRGRQDAVEDLHVGQLRGFKSSVALRLQRLVVFRQRNGVRRKLGLVFKPRRPVVELLAPDPKRHDLASRRYATVRSSAPAESGAVHAQRRIHEARSAHCVPQHRLHRGQRRPRAWYSGVLRS